MVTALCLMVERTMKAKRRRFFVRAPLDQLEVHELNCFERMMNLR